MTITEVEFLRERAKGITPAAVEAAKDAAYAYYATEKLREVLSPLEFVAWYENTVALVESGEAL